MKNNVTCDTFRRAVFHFQLDELPHDERARLQEHLSACERCARLLQVEDAFLVGLKARIGPAEAPPGLETRIRASLREAASPRRGGVVSWLRAPWFAATAASLLLAALLVPGIVDGPGVDVDPPAGAIHVLMQATLVDRECDRAGRSFDDQRRCAHPDHVNALKLPDGAYWLIRESPADGIQLATDRNLRGHRFRVEGDYDPLARTVRLQDVRDLGLDTL